MTQGKPSLPITLSVLFATILSLGMLLFLIRAISVWNKFGESNKLWIIFAFAYAFTLTVSGWFYKVKQFRIAGGIHALLMLGFAGFALYNGLTMLSDKSTMGGQGPDANPVAGIIYLFALVVAGFGALAGLCGITVIRRVFPSKETLEKSQ